jgi:SAM-dependent methyltransferase
VFKLIVDDSNLMSTYSTHAAICAKFYDLTLKADEVSDFIFRHSQSRPGVSGLFVGGMFEIAKGLITSGINLTVVDYTDEMVEIGRSKLPGVKVEKADLRFLPFQDEFDFVFVVGRVFTHMISNDDLSNAFSSCRKVLRRGGYLFFDNYEDSKIQRTNYFNGSIETKEGETIIRRESTTSKLSETPFVVRWDAEYSGSFSGKNFKFSDSIEHRAFSRHEICTLMPRFGFEVLTQGDNFDDTSFFTLARAS